MDNNNNSKAKDFHKIVVATFSSPIGEKLLEHMKETYVDRKIYRSGSTLEDAAYRQGQSDLVTAIVREIERKI